MLPACADGFRRIKQSAALAHGVDAVSMIFSLTRMERI